MTPNVRIGIEIVPAGSGVGSAVDLSLQRTANLIDTRLNSALGKTGAQIDMINRSAGSLLSTFQQLTTGISGIVFLFDRIGGAVKSTLLDPFISLNKQIIEITDNSRKFEYGISTVAGGLSQARLLNLQLQRESANIPTNVAQLRDAGRSLAVNPAFSASIGSGSTAASAASIEQFAELSQKLQLLAPEGVNAENALRQGLGGNFFALRRLGVSPTNLASGIGVSEKDLTGNPSLTLDAISRWADTFLDQSSYSQITNLVSNRYEKLQDAVGLALQKIGDAGFYDSISHKLKTLSDSLFSYFGSQAFDAQAQKISQSLDRVVGSVTHSAGALLGALTGRPSDLSTVSGAVEGVSALLDTFSHAVDALRPAVEGFAATLGLFMRATITLADIASHPNGAAAQSHPALSTAVGAAEQVAVAPLGVMAQTYANIANSSLGQYAKLSRRGLNLAAAPSGTGPSTQPSSGLNPRGDEPYIATLTRALTGNEYFEPNFSGLLSASGASVQQLRALGAQNQSPIDRLQGLSNVFGAVTVDHEPEQFTDFLKRIDRQYNSSAGLLNEDLAHTNDPTQINDINTAKTDLLAKYRNALDSITDSKIADVKDLSEEIWKSISDLPPGARAELQQSILDGTTDAAKQFTNIFGAAPSAGFGISSFPIDVQRRFIDQNTKTNVERLQAAGVNETPTQANQSLLDYYSKQALPQAQGLASRAGDAYSKSSTELNLSELNAAQESVVSLTAKIRDLKYDLNDAGKAFDQFSSQVRQSFETDLGTAISNAIEGVGSLKDVFHSFVNSVVNDFAQMESHNLVQALVGPLGQANQGPGGQGVGGLGGIVGGIVHYLTGGGSSSAINTYGGVGSAAYGPAAPSYGTGGISFSPEYAMVGENGPEAHLPLVRGSNGQLGVQAVGGGRNITIQQTFVTPNPDAFRKSGSQIKRQMRDAIGND